MGLSFSPDPDVANLNLILPLTHFLIHYVTMFWPCRVSTSNPTQIQCTLVHSSIHCRFKQTVPGLFPYVTHWSYWGSYLKSMKKLNYTKSTLGNNLIWPISSDYIIRKKLALGM